MQRTSVSLICYPFSSFSYILLTCSLFYFSHFSSLFSFLLLTPSFPLFFSFFTSLILSLFPPFLISYSSPLIFLITSILHNFSIRVSMFLPLIRISCILFSPLSLSQYISSLISLPILNLNILFYFSPPILFSGTLVFSLSLCFIPPYWTLIFLFS